MSSAHPAAQPWYREPWPWILMSGPAAVIVAGGFTIWIAFATSDGLVAEDYYKQGLGVNRVLEREAIAAQRGIVADIEFAQDRHRVSVSLTGAAPDQLQLRFAHATRPGHDISLRLARVAAGRYEAAVPGSFAPGHWRVQIEDLSPGRASQWRLADNWSGIGSSFTLGRIMNNSAGQKAG